MKDLKSNLAVDVCIPPAQYTSTKNDGTIVDLKGYNGCVAMVVTGVVSTADGSNYFTPTLVVGDDSNLSDGATATELIGSFEVINSTTADDLSAWFVGYYGTKRYARVVLTETGTADAIMGAYIIKGFPIYHPAGTANA